MSGESKIEWTDRTWNPATGCTAVSAGCDHCYAATMARRFAGRNGYPADEPFRYTEHPERLLQPLRWRSGMVFVNSMSDLFHEQATPGFLDKVFAVMAACPNLIFQVLTKRPHTMAEYLAGLEYGPKMHPRLYNATLWVCEQFFGDGAMADSLLDPDHWRWPLPNVWLGTSVESQDVTLPGWNLRVRGPREGESADALLARTRAHPLAWPGRIDALLRCPAAVRFLSCEPLLGPLDLKLDLLETHEEVGYPNSGFLHSDHCEGFCDYCCGGSETLGGIHWVIVGGESGHGARPMHPDWARSLRDQCAAAGVPFFFKQHGGWCPAEVVGSDSPSVRRDMLFFPDGLFKSGPQEGPPEDFARWLREGTLMAKPGKGKAGKLLDGVAHEAYPEVATR